MSQLLANAISRFMGRRFGGVRPDMLLSDEEMEDLRPIYSKASKAVTTRLLPLLLVGTAAITYGAARLLLSREPSVGTPVLDQRTPAIWTSCALVSFFGMALVVAWLETHMIRGRLDADYDRYVATKSGWLPRRKLCFVGGLAGLIVIVFSFYAVNFGERIDDGGIAYSKGIWARVHRPFDQVTAVETYTSLQAPIGLIQRPSMRVRFADGSVFDYVPSGRRGVYAIASHISDHSGVPVVAGAQRP